MTIPVPDTTKGARIVLQIVGPTSALHLGHVPRDWVIVSIGRGLDLVAQFSFERVFKLYHKPEAGELYLARQ